MFTSMLKASRNWSVGAILLLSAAAFVAALITHPRPALAQSSALIEAVPTNWRLQDYIDGNASLYFTGSPAPCVNGNLVLVGGSAHGDSVNRLWSTIMTAKVSGKMVGIFYNPTTCQIQNFYLKEG